MAQALYNSQKHTIPEICKSLNVSRATLYRYIDTRPKSRPNEHEGVKLINSCCFRSCEQPPGTEKREPLTLLIAFARGQCYNAPLQETATIFLAKASESLAGAESEFANSRYNNCANRCYYACFQAAIAALLSAGQPATRSGQHTYRHAFVQAQFVEQLINKQKQYPASLRDVLATTLVLRLAADYEVEQVSQPQAARAIQRTRAFVRAVWEKGGKTT